MKIWLMESLQISLLFLYFLLRLFFFCWFAAMCDEYVSSYWCIIINRDINVIAPHYSCHFTRCSLLFANQANDNKCQIEISTMPFCIIYIYFKNVIWNAFHSIPNSIPFPIISLFAQLSIQLLHWFLAFSLLIAIVILSLIWNRFEFIRNAMLWMLNP